MLKKTKYYVALIKNQVDPTLDTMYNEKYIVINKKKMHGPCLTVGMQSE